MPVTERAAIIGGMFVLAAALVAVIPVILSQRSATDGLRVVDVVIDDADLFPMVDLRLRNVGKDVVYITKVRAIISHIEKLRLPRVAPMLLPLTATYQLALPLDGPRTAEIPVSQVLSPNTTDRFAISLGYSSGAGGSPPEPYVLVLRLEIVFNEAGRAVTTPELVVFLPPNPSYASYTQPEPVEISLSGFTYQDLAKLHTDAVSRLVKPNRVISQRVDLLLHGSTYPINRPLPREGGLADCNIHVSDAMELLKGAGDLQELPDTTSASRPARRRSPANTEASIAMYEVLHRSALRSLRFAETACSNRMGTYTYLRARSAFLIGDFMQAHDAYSSILEDSPHWQDSHREALLLAACLGDRDGIEAYRQALLHKAIGDAAAAERYLVIMSESSCRSLANRAAELLDEQRK